MCGIVGFYYQNWSAEKREHEAHAAADAIAHRGPDDSGVWVAEDGLALGHRRLSILDLSPLGHQPMVSEDTGNVLCYNGEIYNFQDIRTELEHEGIHCKSSGDTEVLLRAIDHWGLEKTVPKCNGMFALGVWLNKERVLQIARDRIGIKPLYYGWTPLGFVFASELKAFYALDGFRMPLSEKALSLFFEHGYITAPHSIFEGIYKLLPGTVLTLKVSQLPQRPETFSPSLQDACLSPKKYWKIPKKSPLSVTNYEEAVEALDTLITSSIKLRTIADVPLGAFLSGGVDSSTVVAIMKALGGGTVKTFSIGFEEQGFNEAPYAKAIAEYLGTEHTELYVPAKDALDIIPELASFYDEPFADSSQIPTCLVSKLARQHVTVSLSGDGGDELFRGYTRYPIAINIWNKLKWCPMPMRKVLAQMITLFPMRNWNALYAIGQHALPSTLREMKYVGLKMHRLAEVMHSKTLAELYCTANTHWRPPYHPVPFHRGDSVLTRYALEKEFTSPYDYLTYIDLHTYLPDDILTKVDRASMAYSLEARVPLLDHRIIEFARSIPSEWCVEKNGKQKKILRDVLEKYVPRKMFERPKAGFGVPISQWLRGDLKDWGESLLTEKALPNDGILDGARIRERWRANQANEIDFHYPLWNVLQFQAWRRLWGKSIG